MSLLTVVQSASKRLGLPNPSLAVATTDNRVLQLVDLANEAGRALRDRHPWQRLTKEKTFTTVAAETQTNAVPTDFGRIINETVFNRTEDERVFGPLTPEEWQSQKSRGVVAIDNQFRIRGNAWLMIPTPTAGQTIAYEYVSTLWVDTTTPKDGVADADGYSADADVAVFDEEMIALEVIWRWQQATGLDYGENFRKAETYITNAIARDGGRRTLTMSSHSIGDFIPKANVREGNWNL